MKQLLLIIFFTFTISGCISIEPTSKNVQKTFTYDYAVDSVDQEELWVRARDYLAKAYGDSRSVLRVQDREEGTLIGRGIETWYVMNYPCLSEYNVRFQSKDGRARLQLELIEGVPALSECQRSWPTQSGYESIVSSFNQFSQGLEVALKQKSSFSDF